MIRLTRRQFLRGALGVGGTGVLVALVARLSQTQLHQLMPDRYGAAIYAHSMYS